MFLLDIFEFDMFMTDVDFPSNKGITKSRSVFYVKVVMNSMLAYAFARLSNNILIALEQNRWLYWPLA